MSNEELVELIQNGDVNRLSELWEQVQAFARQQANRTMILSGDIGGVTVDDLYNSGFIALAAAVKSYNATRGMSFIGWYKYALKSAFAEARGYQSKKRDPINAAMSLDAPVYDDNDLDLVDTVSDPSAESLFEDAEQRIYNEQLHEALDTAINRLPAKTGEVMRSIFFDGKTAKAIAAEQGVSFQLICARKRDGLRRLRRPESIKQIQTFVDQRTPWEWHRGTHVTEQITIERERLAKKYFQQ